MEFTEIEKKIILEKYKPLNGITLTDSMTTVTDSEINFLTVLQSWFTNSCDEIISEKILLRAESLVSNENPILDIHFLYNSLIEHYYKKRDVDPIYLDLAKVYCQKQIDISQGVKDKFQSEQWYGKLPRHLGFERLAIILEKEKKYLESIELCKVADYIGWNSDWTKRINRLLKKNNN